MSLATRADVELASAPGLPLGPGLADLAAVRRQADGAARPARRRAAEHAARARPGRGGPLGLVRRDPGPAGAQHPADLQHRLRRRPGRPPATRCATSTRTIKGKLPDGQPYSALNPETYYWAHATFVEHLVIADRHLHPAARAAPRRTSSSRESVTWFERYGVSARAASRRPGPSSTPTGTTRSTHRLVAAPHRGVRRRLRHQGLAAPDAGARVRCGGWSGGRSTRSARSSPSAACRRAARELLGLPWDDDRERRYRRFARLVPRARPVVRRLPAAAADAPDRGPRVRARGGPMSAAAPPHPGVRRRAASPTSPPPATRPRATAPFTGEPLPAGPAVHRRRRRRGGAAGPDRAGSAGPSVPLAERTPIVLRFASLLLKDKRAGARRRAVGDRQVPRPRRRSSCWACRRWPRTTPATRRRTSPRRERRPACPASCAPGSPGTPRGWSASSRPWNYPLFLAVGDVIPALLAGNAVLSKADSQAPLSLLAARALAREAGLPDDVWQVVAGRGIGARPGDPRRGRPPGLHRLDRHRPRAGRGGRPPADRRLAGARRQEPDDRARRRRRGRRGPRRGAGLLLQRRPDLHRDRADLRARAAPRPSSSTSFAEATRALTLGRRLRLLRRDRLAHHGRPARGRSRPTSRTRIDHGAELVAGGKARPDLGPLFFEPTVLAGVQPDDAGVRRGDVRAGGLGLPRGRRRGGA